MTQLALDLDPPKGPATLSSFHIRSEMPVAEAVAGQERANHQDRRVLAVFRARPSHLWSPSQVRAYMDGGALPVPLLTSVRRSISTLCKRGLLVHHPKVRVMGEHGSKESTWGLA